MSDRVAMLPGCMNTRLQTALQRKQLKTETGPTLATLATPPTSGTSFMKLHCQDTDTCSNMSVQFYSEAVPYMA